MRREPQKMWPVFVLGAVVVFAVVLKIYSWIFPGENEIAGNITVKAGTLASSSELAFSPVNWDTLQSSSIESDLASVKPMQNYEKKDLLVSSDNSSVAIREYATNLKEALKPYSNPNMESEPSLLMKIYNDSDKASLEKLSGSEKSHASALNSLLKLEVPSDITTYHLALLNSVARMHFLVQNMLTVETKPILALTSAKIFGPEVNRFSEALTVLNNSFASRGLVFAPKDGMKIYLNMTK